MHAASVHPEPGSNSRKYCILSPFGAKIYSRAFVALLLFVLSFFFTLRIVRDSTSHFLVFALYLSLCCSIFNDRSFRRLHFRAATRLLYHAAFTLSILFSKLFSSFFPSTLSGDSSTILSLYIYLVKWFLKIFL